MGDAWPAGRPSFFRQVYALLAKDALLEARTKDALGTMVVFSLLVLLVFSLTLDLRPEVAAAVGPGVLWVAVVFGSTLGLGRTFARERDQGTLEGILMAPVDRGAIFAAKVVTNLALMFLMQLVSIPAYVALFGGRVDSAWLLPILVLGTVGLAAVGTLFSAVASHTRAREVMLPVLLFPVIVPLLIGTVQATGAATGSPLARDMPWISLLLAFDLIYVVLGAVVFEYAVEE